MASTKKDVPSWKQYNRHWYEKLGITIWDYIKNVGLMLWSVIKAIPFKIWDLLKSVGRCFQGLWYRFKKGDWRTKISYLIMGFGNFSRGPSQFLIGFLLLAVEALFVVFMIFIGAHNLYMLGTLGITAWAEGKGGVGRVEVDNSVKILIFSVMAFIFIIFTIAMYILNTKLAFNAQKRVEEGKPLSTPKQQIAKALNDNYSTTILALPIFGIIIVTIMPLVVNVFVAFTNYDLKHSPPGNVFDWVGWQSFAEVFGTSYGSVIWKVLGWTLIWAFFATFTNFFFGMFLAMIINKKSIKLKAFWRTCFVIVIAVPDFITLMMMSNFFSYNEVTAFTGTFNQILLKLAKLFAGDPNANVSFVNINWLGSTKYTALLPRVMIIVINLWRGMPFTMLSTYGILMNIPEEMYESSRIDGAGPVRRFVSITFPYIMFVMGPQLITTFTGNINNFNVIFFLTGGGPARISSTGGAVQPGQTDLLITWLYKMTKDATEQEYNHGAVLGLFMFLISSFFALIVFNSSKSIKQEDTFQ